MPQKRGKNMDLLEIMRNRRSVRKYTGEHIEDEKIEKVLQAGMLSASAKARRPWEFIVVRDKDTLEKMALARTHGAAMLKGADAAVVVIADTEKIDVWVEDCSAVMSNMHLMADWLGLGSCWIQGRLRMAAEPDAASGQAGETTEEYLRKLLGFPENYALEAMLSLGMPDSHPEPYDVQKLTAELADKIHRERY